MFPLILGDLNFPEEHGCTLLDMLSAIRAEIELALHNASGSLSKPQISWT